MTEMDSGLPIMVEHPVRDLPAPLPDISEDITDQSLMGPQVISDAIPTVTPTETESSTTSPPRKKYLK